MKTTAQLVRDGHVGHLIFGRLIFGNSTYLTVEPVEGSLDVGTYSLEINAQGKPQTKSGYLLLTDAVGSYAQPGLRCGLKMSPKGWDLTDKVTITSYITTEIAKELSADRQVALEVSYREYPKAKATRAKKAE